MTENAKRVAMTEACADGLMAWAAVRDGLIDTGTENRTTRQSLRSFLIGIEILPNPEPAPAEAVAALASMRAFVDEFTVQEEYDAAENIVRTALARLAELEKQKPSEEQVRAKVLEECKDTVRYWMRGYNPLIRDAILKELDIRALGEPLDVDRVAKGE